MAMLKKPFTSQTKHAQLIIFGAEMNLVLKTAVVDMYSKCRRMEDVIKVSNLTPEYDVTSNAVKAFRGAASPNVISWTSLTAGFTENGLEEESFQLFAEMRAAGVQPNSFTLSTILGACNKMRHQTGLVKTTSNLQNIVGGMMSYDMRGLLLRDVPPMPIHALATALANAPPEQQRTMLGEALYPLIKTCWNMIQLLRLPACFWRWTSLKYCI
ncbi:hypothetical protein KIW84_031841 [Lathyrus oleraceus]|uniref:Pentatricopeptide repeat-containing protein n=1 Tax=Pisum sativum TaxID=3888 RepID=A0A9D4XTB7_PEA|nr:hypothetical protein KIW84_031841 [Pisum sativum]